MTFLTAQNMKIVFPVTFANVYKRWYYLWYEKIW